ncbi:MAG: hypothetical protein K8I65_13990 [Thermoanaerobaculia bacterium]|nr:hypothetical protein [Thermoanaerobaculia bacterium]
MRVVALFVGLSLAALASPAAAEKGPVSHRISGCDWFLIDLPSGYALVEWYGGNDPDKGDEIVGDFDEYGFRNVYNITADQELRVWVDDFWLSKGSALEDLYEKCD